MKLQPWTKLLGTLHLFFYQSTHAYVIPPFPQSMLTVMCYSLLLSLASATFISTLIGEEEGGGGGGGTNDEACISPCPF